MKSDEMTGHKPQELSRQCLELGKQCLELSRQWLMRGIVGMCAMLIVQTRAYAQQTEIPILSDSSIAHSDILTSAKLDIKKTLKQKNMGKWGIAAANYSGISRLNKEIYAVCDDKSKCDGFTIMQIRQDSIKGKIIDIQASIPTDYKTRLEQGKGQYRDCEGVAFCKERNTVFVSGEEDQRILEYTLDGAPTGNELVVPECFSKANIRTNYGFEALTYSSQTGLFWTTTESTLKQDGKSASLANKEVSNKLRLQSFGTDLQPRQQFIYEMDKPSAKKSKGTYIHGVPSLLALPDGCLIVMEREEYVPSKYIGAFCRVKLYIVDPSSVDADKQEQPLPKRLLTEFSTQLRPRKMNLANYEGMCLGRTLQDGSPTLLLICDSQGGQGNKLFHLKDYIKVLILTHSK